VLIVCGFQQKGLLGGRQAEWLPSDGFGHFARADALSADPLRLYAATDLNPDFLQVRTEYALRDTGCLTTVTTQVLVFTTLANAITDYGSFATGITLLTHLYTLCLSSGF
jgi:hypothetical protein